MMAFQVIHVLKAVFPVQRFSALDLLLLKSLKRQ